MNLRDAEHLMLAAGGVLGVMALVVPRQANEDTAVRSRWQTTLLVLLPFLLLHGLFRQQQHFFGSFDEYCRLELALDWAAQPYFHAGDQVWLPGHFYVLGGLFRAGVSLDSAIAITSVLGIALSIHFAVRLATFVWRSQTAGVMAGLLAGSQWMMLWSASNPYAEVFLLPAVMGALDAWLRGFAVRGDSVRPTAAHRYYLIAAAWVGFGTLFRYEMWYAGVLLGMFCAWLAVSELRRGALLRAGLALLACALIAAFPLPWLAAGWQATGSPFGFVQTASDQNDAVNAWHDFSSPLAKFLVYPLVLFEFHPQRLGLALIGIVLAMLPKGRTALPLVLATGALLLVAMGSAVAGGIGSANPARLVLFLLLPLLCLAGGPLALLWHARPPLRRLAQLAVIGLLLATSALALLKARQRYTNGWGVDPGVLAIMTRLERESDPGRWTHNFPTLRPRAATLQIYHGGVSHEYWMARYHSGDPLRIGEITNTTELAEQLANAPIGTRFLIRLPRPPIAFPAGCTLLESPLPYELWCRDK